MYIANTKTSPIPQDAVRNQRTHETLTAAGALARHAAAAPRRAAAASTRREVTVTARAAEPVVEDVEENVSFRPEWTGLFFHMH